MVECPVCFGEVEEGRINQHLDADCQEPPSPAVGLSTQIKAFASQSQPSRPKTQLPRTPWSSTQPVSLSKLQPQYGDQPSPTKPKVGKKRTIDSTEPLGESINDETPYSIFKRGKPSESHRLAPLAERMRPMNLDDVLGQELVAPNGMIRSLLEKQKIPSMILWGESGTGKTTIARLLARHANYRFVEINSTSSGIAECKKLFNDAKAELLSSGRQTLLFIDELHSFNRSQQQILLAPVEAGTITLVGATTENPSFRIVHALLSRCKVFSLSKLTRQDLVHIMKKAIEKECGSTPALLDDGLLEKLAAFSDGDARKSLNLLESALALADRPGTNPESIQKSLTQTLVYDRSGDQHYNTISAFHKSIRGSDADATLYYLARMLRSGEDPLYIARRMIVIASEDVGLADNSLLPLAIAAQQAVERVGLPEARINLAHVATALALAPKSTRAYRGLKNALAAIDDPSVAGLPIPMHLRQASMKHLEDSGDSEVQRYKYNPDYVDGRVSQSYLPESLSGSEFLPEFDLSGTKIDPDLETTNFFLQDVRIGRLKDT